MIEPNWPGLTPNEALEKLAQHAEEHAAWHAQAEALVDPGVLYAATKASPLAAYAATGGQTALAFAKAYRSQIAVPLDLTPPPGEPE
jgi:hypothetical protein